MVVFGTCVLKHAASCCSYWSRRTCSSARHNVLLHLLSVPPWSSHTAHELPVNPQIPSALVCSWGENCTKSEKNRAGIVDGCRKWRQREEGKIAAGWINAAEPGLFAPSTPLSRSLFFIFFPLPSQMIHRGKKRPLPCPQLNPTSASC